MNCSHKLQPSKVIPFYSLMQQTILRPAFAGCRGSVPCSSACLRNYWWNNCRGQRCQCRCISGWESLLQTSWQVHWKTFLCSSSWMVTLGNIPNKYLSTYLFFLSLSVFCGLFDSLTRNRTTNSRHLFLVHSNSQESLVHFFKSSESILNS